MTERECSLLPDELFGLKPDVSANHDPLHRLVGRIRCLLTDVRAEEAKALPEWEASTDRHEWAALYRCGNKLEEALSSLDTIAPNGANETKTAEGERIKYGNTDS